MEVVLDGRISVNLHRVIVGLYWLVFAVVTVASAAFFWQTKAEYNRLLRLEAASEQRLEDAKARMAEQDKILKRLQTDPAYVEKIIRQRLLYAKPEEFIFRFEN
jgi:cell division protein FtsB